jgi:anaerobic magnesium-protoporphyrin IX monomethyl ester cyclase
VNQKKVLLINSHVRSLGVSSRMVGNQYEEPYPSVGLLYLASTLKRAGYEVRYLDLPVHIKRAATRDPARFDGEAAEALVERLIADEVAAFRPDLAGINTLFSGKFPATVRISELLKGLSPSLPVAVGGYHPTVFHREILERIPTIDFVCIGEGEESFLAVLDRHFSGRPLSDVDGFSFRDGPAVRVNPKTTFIADLDRLPMPAWDLLDLADYEIEPDKWERFWHNPRGLALKYRWPILTSRSCPWKCNFCGMHLVHGRNIRFRSAQNVYAEMKALYDGHGVNYFALIDDNFTASKKRVLELADLVVKGGLRIYIDTPNGISMNHFDRDILEAMKAMGLLRIYFAIESGSEYIRNTVIGKKLPTRRIREISDLMRGEKDIMVRAFFIAGMPQETAETLEESYQLMKSIAIDEASVHFATPIPGTRLYEEAHRDKLFLMPETDILFAENYQQASDEPLIKPPALSVEELKEFRRRVAALFAGRYAALGTERRFPIHHLVDL